MPALFVSYIGNVGGKPAQGWVVMNWGPINSATSIEDLTKAVERARAYDAGSLLIVNFRRLESDTAGQSVKVRE